MENFFRAIESIVNEIKIVEERRKRLAEIIKNSKISSSQFLENELIKKVERKNLNAIIAGIDSSILQKSLHGIDILLIRAVSVIYDFENGKLKNVEYYSPSLFFEPIVFQNQFSEIDLDLATNIVRQKKEVDIARETIEKFKPNFVLMDGSILPHYIPSIDKDSPLYSYYKKAIEAYKKLFEASRKFKTILAGIIEDSRAARFCNLIAESLKLEKEFLLILEKSKDTNLLEYILKKGERTATFYYSSQPSIFEFNSKDFVSFYVKVCDFDFPLRVDFLNSRENVADEISSILLSMVTSEDYSFPSVLIEADLRARLSEKEMEIFYNELVGRLGFISSIRKRRRERRPF